MQPCCLSVTCQDEFILQGRRNKLALMETSVLCWWTYWPSCQHAYSHFDAHFSPLIGVIFVETIFLIVPCRVSSIMLTANSLLSSILCQVVYCYFSMIMIYWFTTDFSDTGGLARPLIQTHLREPTWNPPGSSPEMWWLGRVRWPILTTSGLLHRLVGSIWPLRSGLWNSSLAVAGRPVPTDDFRGWLYGPGSWLPASRGGPFWIVILLKSGEFPMLLLGLCYPCNSTEQADSDIKTLWR